jgi:hypothetical protein
MIRAWRSWVAALIPSLFWRRVKPEHSCSRVVLLWPLVLLGSLALVLGLAQFMFLTLSASLVPGRRTATPTGLAYTPATVWERVFYRAHRVWIEPFESRRAWMGGRQLAFLLESWAGPIAVLAAATITGLTLASLTTSRRVCGVKGTHILRASVYRLTPLGILLLMSSVERTAVLADANGWLWRQELRPFWLLINLSSVVWAAWWWHAAIARGWRMPKAHFVALLMAVVDLLTLATVYVSLSPIGPTRW